LGKKDSCRLLGRDNGVSFVFLFSNAYEDIIPGGVLCCPDGMLCIFFSMYNEILTFYPIIFTDESEVFSKYLHI